MKYAYTMATLPRRLHAEDAADYVAGMTMPSEMREGCGA
jgi:hypothetical protein